MGRLSDVTVPSVMQVMPSSSCGDSTNRSFPRSDSTIDPSGSLNQFTSCVWYFCSLAHRSTISTFRIQLSGQSDADSAFMGSSNSSPSSSFCLAFGTLVMSMPSSDGAVQMDARPVMPTQSISVSRSLPG